MAISATYVSATSFTVTGDHTAELRASIRLRLLMGVDGTVESSVSSSSYSGGSGLTTCVIVDSVLTANLATIQIGNVYGDEGNSSSNLAPHEHTGAYNGGDIPAAGMSSAEVATAQSLPVPAVGDAKEFLRENSAGDGFETVDLIGTANQLVGADSGGTDLEAKTLSGTANQVTVTHAANLITLSGPQNLHAAATPTFAGMTLSGLTGIMEAKGVSAIGIVASSGALQVLRRNSANNAYEFASIALKELSEIADAVTDSATEGDILYHNGSQWTRLARGSNTQFLWLNSGVPAWVAAQLKHLDDVAAAVTDSIAQGDILYADATPDYNRLAIGSAGQFLIVSGGVPAWHTLDGDDLPAMSTTKKGGVPATVDTDSSYFLSRAGWALPPGAGGGEANTISSNGGGVSLYDTKVGIDLQLNSLNSDQFALASQLISLIGAAPGPDYTPPAIRYKDADEITVPIGVYYPLGHRIDGQYQDQNYVPWTVSSAVDVDVDAGGTLIGGDVISSWYSVFMTSASTFLVLPFIRVDAISYIAPNTRIQPADHDDGTSPNDNFVSANDCFNTYRLVLLNWGTYHGTVYEIDDSVDGSPDYLSIVGDKTSEISATEWLQMIPPDGTDCLYLGCIRLDSSGDLMEFRKAGWRTTFKKHTTINGVCDTSPANTEIGPAVPPVATGLEGSFYCNSEAISATGAQMYIVYGTDGDATNNIIARIWLHHGSAGGTYTGLSSVASVPITAISILRNYSMVDSSGWIAASAASIVSRGYVE